jgi:NADH-quinone oxidoreductase subunit E
MVDVTKVRQIVEQHGAKKEYLIAMLLDCQEEYCYLPREVLEEVSIQLSAPLTSVLGVATFFRAFSLKPVGRYQVHVCMGTACNIQGGPRLVEALERELKVKRGETTPDMLFSLDTVNCVGCCGLAPVITVGQDVHGKLKQSSIPRIVKQYRAKGARHAETIH